MKTLIKLCIIIVSPFVAYFGLITLSEAAPSFLAWCQADMESYPEAWGFGALVAGLAIACLLLLFFEWLESGRKTPDYQISMARHRAESLIQF